MSGDPEPPQAMIYVPTSGYPRRPAPGRGMVLTVVAAVVVGVGLVAAVCRRLRWRPFSTEVAHPDLPDEMIRQISKESFDLGRRVQQRRGDEVSG